MYLINQVSLHFNYHPFPPQYTHFILSLGNLPSFRGVANILAPLPSNIFVYSYSCVPNGIIDTILQDLYSVVDRRCRFSASFTVLFIADRYKSEISPINIIFYWCVLWLSRIHFFAVLIDCKDGQIAKRIYSGTGKHLCFNVFGAFDYFFTQNV